MSVRRGSSGAGGERDATIDAALGCPIKTWQMAFHNRVAFQASSPEFASFSLPVENNVYFRRYLLHDMSGAYMISHTLHIMLRS